MNDNVGWLLESENTFKQCKMWKADLTISGSIAICILDENAIIRGVGNELYFHSTTVEKLKITLKGLIHGIVKGSGINERKLVVFAEKEFALLSWNTKFEFELLFRGRLTDWISATIFLDETAEFVLLTSHSVLLRFDYIQDEKFSTVCKVNGRSSCEDKCTLYCSYLFGKSWNDLTVFGANAFGEVIVWQPEAISTEHPECGLKVKILQSISAHNGVVFSIDFDPINNLLITTSDDRSVRFWNVFPDAGWLRVAAKPTASGYGHMARVFQGKFLEYGGSTYVATVGEDSYLCVWHTTGELIYKQRQQFGAIIWNLSYHAGRGTIYTVGSTGNLIASDINEILQSHSRSLANKLISVNASDPTEYVAKVKFVTSSLLVGVTNQNRLVLCNKKKEKWENVDAFSGYKCTVLEVYRNLIAICGYKRMTLFECDKEELRLLFDTELLTAVIRSFHFLGETHFMLSDDQGNCVLLKRDDFSSHYYIELPKCKERFLTAALMVTDDMFVVSNRLGNLMMYRYNIQNDSYILQSTLKHPHGHLGATSFKAIVVEMSYAYIQSAGHDGTLKELKLDFETNTLSISNRRNVPIAWIENMVQVDMTDLCLGFNDNHFVVWSEEHDITLQIACGGGHRCWDYHIHESNNQEKNIKLIFIKNKNVLQYDLPLFHKSSANIVLPNRNRWHVRPCNMLEVIECEASDETVTVSAGDDNLIKISHLKHDETLPTCLEQKTEIHTHISNVRALKILNLNSNGEYLIFSGGGRAQLCVSKFHLRNNVVTELLNYTLKPNATAKQMQEIHNFDPETRIMSIDVFKQSTSEYFIYAACSDGLVRKLQINENFEIKPKEQYFYGKCVLQVRLVSDVYVLSATTEGFVYIHDFDLRTTFLKLSLHSSGINGLDVKWSQTELHLLTGGDDQAVVYSKISTEKPDDPTLVEKRCLPPFHSAQVTAVRFAIDGNHIYSSGVDQNLVIYDLTDKTDVRNIFTCVADVKGISLSKRKSVILIYGCGLQAYVS